jgi:hypothetical protein
MSRGLRGPKRMEGLLALSIPPPSFPVNAPFFQKTLDWMSFLESLRFLQNAFDNPPIIDYIKNATG